jgi:hypothetical protein
MSDRSQVWSSPSLTPVEAPSLTPVESPWLTSSLTWRGDAMVDLGVALTWIAFSAVSAKGLSAFARAAASTGAAMELASLEEEGAALEHDGSARPLVNAPFCLPYEQS